MVLGSSFLLQMRFSLGLSYSHMPQGFSLAHAEVPKDDVQDLLGAASTGDAAQVTPGKSQCLSSQG